MNGVVQWFNGSKGWGFIKSNDKSYFLHFNQIQMEGYKTLKSGDCVTFEPEEWSRGLRAMRVIPLEACHTASNTSDKT